MTKHQVISKEQARQLKLYLKYMDFGEALPNRRFLLEKMMYQNLMMGNIQSSLIDDLRINYLKAHPDAVLPDILRMSV